MLYVYGSWIVKMYSGGQCYLTSGCLSVEGLLHGGKAQSVERPRRSIDMRASAPLCGSKDCTSI